MAAVTQIASSAPRLLAEGRARFNSDVRAALELGRQALAAAQAAGDSVSEGEAHFLMGECCEALAEQGDALAHFEAALRLTRAEGDRSREADVHRMMGFTQDNMGSFELAMEHHLAALHLYQALGDDKGRARVLRTIGVSASKSKDHEQGLSWYRQSLEIAKRIGDDDAAARTLNNIGLDLKNLGRLEESLAAYEEAIALHQSLGATRLEAQVRGNLAHTLELMHRDEEAETAYLRAIETCRAMDCPHGLQNSLNGIGRLYLRINRLAEARTHLLEALEVAEHGNYRPDIIDALETLAKVEQKRGDAAAAFAYFQRFHEVSGSMVHEESQRRLKGLELRLRVDQAQREALEQRQKSRELTDAYERLQAAGAEKNELLALLERQSREDPLTGLANRRHWDEKIATVFAESLRDGLPLAVALIDCDHFKRVNDSFSHATGDATLREIARLLRANIREGDLAARLGGEEFAIVFPGLDLDGARKICEHIRLTLESHDWVDIHQWLKVTVSAGVAEVSGHARHEAMLAEADARLRIAKESGRNRVVAGEVRVGPERSPASVPETPNAVPRDVRESMIYAEQVRGSYANLPMGFAAAFVVAILLCLVVRDLIPARVWGGWLAAVTALSAGLWYLHRRYQHRKPAGEAARKWGRFATAGALATGCLWGLGTLLLHTPDSIDYQIMVAATAAIVGSSVAFASATYLPPFFAFFYPAVLPTAVVFLTKSDATRVVVGLMLLLYLPIVTRFALSLNRAFLETLRLRFQNVSLVTELRDRKEAAEGANLAKSRFLAAASHDLRQPMHALGLFLQALRQGKLGERERQLVDNMGESFNAMDGLFSALLDVSRLDAGVVEPRVTTFPVTRLLDRMRNEYAAQAAAKGLALSVRPCRAFVRSDPVLLEEIVGNCLSNAIRYTTAGRVLVGCRRLSAQELRIEVWDTGPGIPVDKQREVFREFVQLGNPERDRRRGLGLGLAIVDRVSRLLEHKIDLRSIPGRGSGFQVHVPIGRMEDAEPPEADEARGVAPFAGRFVVVVDDEPAVLEAMASLLTEWGFKVATADSGAMILGKLANASSRPDLVLCDYRLRNGESGIEVIRDIRDEFNEEIPAALITGDTGPDRLKEARESGLPLLHKPVRAARLRALMGRLLSEKADASVT